MLILFLYLQINNELRNQNEGLRSLTKLIRHPGDKLREISQQIDGIETHLANLLERILLISKGEVNSISSSLKEFSPYVMVENSKNKIENRAITKYLIQWVTPKKTTTEENYELMIVRSSNRLTKPQNLMRELRCFIQ